jgi:hypothetical protein
MKIDINYLRAECTLEDLRTLAKHLQLSLNQSVNQLLAEITKELSTMSAKMPQLPDDILFELLSNTEPRAVQKFCMLSSQHAAVCRSERGQKIIAGKKLQKEALALGLDLQDLPANALFIVAEKGSPELIQELIEREFDINEGNMTDETPLMLAASAGNQAAVEKLIELGADLDYQSQYNANTALTNAQDAGHFELVGLLEAAGADMSVLEQF